MNRRQALLLAAPTVSAQRLAPVDELVSVFEAEEWAQRQLPPNLFATIAGSDRAGFDRITLRPRLMVNTTGIDLTVNLFGDTHFAPILVGPTARQGRFHPEAEKGMLEGATAAKTTVVFAAETTLPMDEIAKTAQSPYWVQVDPGRDPQTIPASAKALVITLQSGAFRWADLDQLRRAWKKPVLLKGIMNARDAQLAVQRGVDAIIISNYRSQPVPGLASPIEVLPSIAAEVGKRVPILIDGSFRRGSDILKALALGAQAALVGRPTLWGLSAYGGRGVRQVLEQLQTELARDMAMCGKVTLSQLGPDLVRIHRR